MDIPESMKAELGDWNDGAGIDLESWIGCMGNFSLAVGYGSFFWPNFYELEGYIFRGEEMDVESLRRWESQPGITRMGVEKLVNHMHLDNIQYIGCNDISRDKLLFLGTMLKEIYEAKLKWQFPDKPCVVEFYVPPDVNELWEYQVLFWQRCHEV